MSTQNKVNPAPLGLLGFGLATILLNIHNAGFIPLSNCDYCDGRFAWWYCANYCWYF